jgi:nucleoside-diphosphate-sugar epimerase
VRILVTGASGFVGSRLTAIAVAEGADVTVLAEPQDPLTRLEGLLPRVRVIRLDLGDIAALESELADLGAEVCIHLAWYTEPGKYLEGVENVRLLSASLGLLEMLARVGCGHVLVTGTCAEYDTSQGYLREDSPTRPATLYAAAKHALHIVGERLTSLSGMGLTWARLFYIYGPGEHQRRLIPSVIRSLRAEEDFRAPLGGQVRDYLYVEDVAAALWHLARHRLAGVYNVCSGVPVALRSLLETVGQILGCAERIHYDAVPDRNWEPQFVCGDNTRLLDTGWTAKVPLQAGLVQTVEWWTLHSRVPPGEPD